MKLPNFPEMSYEEYLTLREKSGERFEYIDGVVYMVPSPSIKHQLVSSNIYTQFGMYLKGKSAKCLLHRLI
ncbi:putative restriction endonuclease [Anoxybacillus vitaminiphilus]|uniref:Putative restriction endonuclease n=1 Tax=Paranoxybacillus vitaminiphilus TaxID=581036 RepID=A0A327YQ91_9BACL|nr:putative restriction endonuclease [Anoxybacillus vitaminiphilus]